MDVKLKEVLKNEHQLSKDINVDLQGHVLLNLIAVINSINSILS
jgi:hypothetical protein